MLTVDDYGQIRRAYRDGLGIRAIARTFHHSRRNVRKALAGPEPQPYTRARDPAAPKLGPFKAIIDQILAEDEQAPRKQRHTAAQIFRRLRDEQGYTGGYDQVRRYLGGHRRRRIETFIPLAHEPGQRLELDFGHIYADFPDSRRQVPVLLPTWSFSNFAFTRRPSSCTCRPRRTGRSGLELGFAARTHPQRHRLAGSRISPVWPNYLRISAGVG